MAPPARAAIDRPCNLPPIAASLDLITTTTTTTTTTTNKQPLPAVARIPPSLTALRLHLSDVLSSRSLPLLSALPPPQGRLHRSQGRHFPEAA